MRRHAPQILGAAALLCVLSLAATSHATDGQQTRKSETARQRDAARSRNQKKTPATTLTTAAAGKTVEPKRPADLDATQRDSAMKFAKENHPELVPLITSMKRRRPAEYQRALRELLAASTRFGRLKGRVAPERYEQQLTLWKLDSRIRLQLARWSLKRDKRVEAEIREALATRRAIQLEQYREDVTRTEERLRRAKQNLATVEARDPDKEWQRMAASVERKARQARQRTRQASQQSEKKSEKTPAGSATDRSDKGRSSKDRSDKSNSAAGKKTEAGSNRPGNKDKSKAATRKP